MVLQVCLKQVDQVTPEDSSLLKCYTMKTVQDWTPGLMVRALCTTERLVTFFFFLFFHSCTMHLDTINVFYLPTDAQQSCFKKKY